MNVTWIIIVVCLIFDGINTSYGSDGSYRVQHDCDPKNCDDFGICYKEDNKHKCSCLSQYRQGDTCTDTVDLCKESIVGKCFPRGTARCGSYFGFMECECKSFKYYGRLCDVEGKANYKSLSMPMVYLSQESDNGSLVFASYLPNLTTNYKLSVVFKNRRDVLAIHIIAAGYRTVHNITNKKFKMIDPKLVQGFPFPIIQTITVESKRIFRHSSLKNISVFAEFKNHHERFDFQLYPITPSNSCATIVRFAGGPCSTVNYITPKLIQNMTHRLKIYTIPMCVEDENSTDIKLGYYLFDMFNKSLEDLPFSFGSFSPSSFTQRNYAAELYTITVKAEDRGGGEANSSYDMCWFENRYSYARFKVPYKMVYNPDYSFPIVVKFEHQENTIGYNRRINITCTTIDFSPKPNEYDLEGSPCSWYFLAGNISYPDDVTEGEWDIKENFVWHNAGQYVIGIQYTFYNSEESNVYDFNISVVTTYNESERLLTIECFYNCGDGNRYSVDVVDRTKPIYLKAVCQSVGGNGCSSSIQYRWDILDFEMRDKNWVNMDFSDWLIIPANTLPNRNEFIVTLSTLKSGGYSEYYLCTRTPLLLSYNDLYSICQYDYHGRKFINFIDRIDLCLNVKLFKWEYGFHYQFFYRVFSDPKRLGIMVDHGSSPYIADVLLPSSRSLGKLTVIVLTNNFVESQFEKNIQLVSPISDSKPIQEKLNFIEEIFNGKHKKWHRTSIKYSMDNDELAQFVQKFYFVFNELRALPIPKNKNMFEKIVNFETEVHNLLYTSFSKFTFVNIFDLMQYYSLIEMHLLTMEHPLTLDEVNSIGKLLVSLITKIKNIIVADLITFKHQRDLLIKTVIIPLLEGITALSDSQYLDKDLLDKGLQDRMVNIKTREEIDLIGDYNVQVEIPVLPPNFTFSTESENQTASVVTCYKLVLDIMGFINHRITNTSNVKEIIEYKPKTFVNSTEAEFPTGYAYVEVFHFQRGTFPVINEGFCTLADLEHKNFNDIFVFHLLVSDGWIFWRRFKKINKKVLMSKFQMLVYIRILSDVGSTDSTMSYTAKVHFEIPNTFRFMCMWATVTRLKKNENNDMSIMSFLVPKKSSLSVIVEINVRGRKNVLTVVVTKLQPSVKDFKSNSAIFRGIVTGKKQILVDKNLKSFYVGVATENKSVFFQACAYHFACISSKIDKEENSHYSPKSDDYVYCEMTETTDLLSYITIPVRLIATDYVKVSLKFHRTPSFVIYIFWFIGLIILFCLSLYGWRRDMHDSYEKTAHYLVDNRKYEKYMYVIIVITGHYPNAGTTSRVGIKLYGDKANSKRHVLRSVMEVENTFERCSVNMYTLTTGTHLGRIAAVELWLDHRGHSPSWYCEKLIVRDYVRKREWVFMVKRWFSFIKDAKKIHQIIYQTFVKQQSIHRKIFNLEDFYYHHKWFGMLTHEPFGSLTRTSKIIFCFTYLTTASHIIAAKLGLHVYDKDANDDYAEIFWDITKNAAIEGSIIAALITHIFVLIVRNSQWLPSSAPYGNEKTPGVDPMAQPGSQLPFIFRLVALGICGVLVAYNVLFMFSIGYNFGVYKSYMWLLAMGMSLCFDIFIIENIFIMARSIFWRVIRNREDVQRFRNDMVDRYIEDEIKYATNEHRRHLIRKDQITPLPCYFRRALADREFKFSEYRRVTIELLMYGFFLITLCFVFMTHRDTFSYHAKRTIEKSVVNGSYTDTISFNKIASVSDIWDYFNRTLLHSVHWRPYGWLVDTNFKLISVPRMRQIRMKPHTCRVPDDLSTVLHAPECYGILDSKKQEKKNFNPEWAKEDLSKKIEKKDRLPFLYIKPKETSNDLISSFYVNPAGGYYTFLTRSALDNRKWLNHLKKKKWIDEATRLIVVELSTYNVNAKILNSIQLVFRITAMGDIQTEYNIYSLKFTQSGAVFNSIEDFMYKLFILTVSLICVYQAFLFAFTSWTEYFTTFWNYYDIVVIVVGFILTNYISTRVELVARAMANAEMHRYDTYIDFVPAIAAQYLVEIFSGLLLFIVIFRIWRLLTINRLFRANHYTIEYSLCAFAAMTILLAITVLGFTTAFYYLLGPYYEFASTFDRALLLFTSVSLGLRPRLDLNELNHQGLATYVIYVMFYLIFRIFFVSIFVGIVVVNFSLVKRRIVREELLKIRYWHYIVERIFCSKIMAEKYRYNLRLRAKYKAQ